MTDPVEKHVGAAAGEAPLAGEAPRRRGQNFARGKGDAQDLLAAAGAVRHVGSAIGANRANAKPPVAACALRAGVAGARFASKMLQARALGLVSRLWR